MAIMKMRLEGSYSGGMEGRTSEVSEAEEDEEIFPYFLRDAIEDAQENDSSASRKRHDIDLGRYPEGNEMLYDDSESGEADEAKTQEEQIGESVLGIAASVAKSEDAPDFEPRLMSALQYCNENHALPDGLEPEDRIVVAMAYSKQSEDGELPGGLSNSERIEVENQLFFEMLKEIQS